MTLDSATDLLGDALLSLEADGTPGGLLLVAGETEPPVPVSATRTTEIPAPAPLLLLATALLLVGKVENRSKRRYPRRLVRPLTVPLEEHASLDR